MNRLRDFIVFVVLPIILGTVFGVAAIQYNFFNG